MSRVENHWFDQDWRATSPDGASAKPYAIGHLFLACDVVVVTVHAALHGAIEVGSVRTFAGRAARRRRIVCDPKRPDTVHIPDLLVMATVLGGIAVAMFAMPDHSPLTWRAGVVFDVLVVVLIVGLVDS